MSQIVSCPLKVVSTEKKTSSKNPAAPKTFWITKAYVQAPGMLFPQATEIFVGDAENILAPGDYVVDLSFSIKENRLSVELGFQAARPVAAKAA